MLWFKKGYKRISASEAKTLSRAACKGENIRRMLVERVYDEIRYVAQVGGRGIVFYCTDREVSHMEYLREKLLHDGYIISTVYDDGLSIRWDW